jgi:hypothetical protein
MPRTIAFDLRIDWGLDTSYSDESARLVAANGSVRLAAPESGITSPRGTVDQCTITLNNMDGRFSPLLTTSPIYADIAGGGAYHAPMYLRVSIDGGGTYSRVFTGVLKIPREGPPYPGVASTVEIDCRSRDEILLNKRMSTPIATFRAQHDSGATEANVILNWLSQAGIPNGETVLDPGLIVLPWAWLDDESPVEDIWQLAAAAGGRFYCDQDGIFRYENMTHWLFAPHNTSRETLTKAGYSQMDGPAYDDRELYNGVTVVASPRDQLVVGPLWSAGQVITIPAGGAKAMTAKLRQPAYQINAVNYTAVSSSGRDMSSAITVSMVQFAQRVELTISNSDATYAVDMLDLNLVGVSVNGSPTLEETRLSSNAFWTAFTTARPGRTRLLRGSSYVQTQAQAAMLAEFLRDRYQLPRLSWTLRGVPGDPFRRLGDRVTVGNADAMSANRDGFITSLTWRLSAKGFGQDIEVLDAGLPSDGTGLYQSAAYFVIGSNNLGSGAGSNHGQLFY